MIRPYISLDIESTGLSEESEILQIGAVLDDGVSPVDSLRKVNVIVDNGILKHVESFAAGMNSWIFKEIQNSMLGQKTQIQVLPFKAAVQQFFELVSECSKLAMQFDVDNSISSGRNLNKKIQLAGKNVGAFDFARINYQCNLKDFQMPKLIQHRCIDVGSVFFKYFGYNPSLDDINTYLGRESVSHNALDDAVDVVCALRFAYKQ